MLTPRYPHPPMVRAAGDFEGYLSFGIGLAARGGYHISSLAGPDRVVIDFTYPAPPDIAAPSLGGLVGAA